MAGASIVILAILAQTSTVGTNAEDKSKAQGLLVEGASLYQKGNYLGALDRFNAAYAAYPSSKIWFNIGLANRDLGRELEAREAFRRFLDEVPNASREDKADVQAWLSDIEKRLGQLTITCAVAGAEISLDGKSVGRSPLRAPVWTTPGQHQLTAIQAGVSPMVEYVEVAPGVMTTVEMRLGQSLPVAGTARTELAVKPLENTTNGWWLGRKWTWVAAGSTVLLAGSAAIVGTIVKSRFDDLKGSCGLGSPAQLGCSDSDISSLHTRKVTANVLWGLAGAAAVATGVLFFVEGHQVAVAPIAGETAGMLARVEF
jgi:hypothetical protein